MSYRVHVPRPPATHVGGVLHTSHGDHDMGAPQWTELVGNRLKLEFRTDRMPFDGTCEGFTIRLGAWGQRVGMQRREKFYKGYMLTLFQEIAIFGEDREHEVTRLDDDRSWWAA